MSTVNWSGAENPALPATRTVSLDSGDDSAWTPANGSYEIAVDGGSAFTLSVYRSYNNAHDDDILCDTQDETERVARYDFTAPGFIRVAASAVTGGPVTVTFAR